MMTDNEIIKALEYCTQQGITSECERCEVKNGCRSEPIVNALNVITRQKAEIERLKGMNHRCIYYSDEEITEYCVDSPCPEHKTLTELKAEIKAEAIKEFAEIAKNIVSVSFDYEGEVRYKAELVCGEIDIAANRMVGDV